ncbi:hypothetical protein BKP35_04920 [Anaerobacillus arseniciselenatis]|uniref:Flagellar Assembly Protein A N-terminal region domain-containing protein n=1 Tax=Anaerobacillus arseniciselenatis TaxID=85682 RepID=A0A1S2LS88_9BACI|nr:FapA family protein [Anaerobacillus arseniciselenatis]OIJ15194.1 hypothetical protein BKP35_04920 [Anaerobacillus arseniciselenatis]
MPNQEKQLLQLIKEMELSTRNEEINEKISKQPYPLEVEYEVPPNENDGYIEVRDNELFIINSTENGAQPILKFNPNIRVTINGFPQRKDTPVFENDTIEFQPIIPELYSISLSDDHMVCYVQLNKELFQQYLLKNKKRSLLFMIELEAIPKTVNINEICNQIIEDLMKKGIQVQINTTRIIQELNEPTFQRLIVAEGLPIIPSRDAKLETYFRMVPTEIFDEVNGKINYKDRLKIPSVQAGEVIAQYYPPKEGKSGFTVLGKQLLPKPPKLIELRAKSRVKITDDGKCIAIQSGRPSVTGNYIKYIDILETYVIDSDVDIQTGNIYFTGDVIIKGDVKDDMQVEASGSIYIYGNVYHSRITALQNVFIAGTVMNSNISAGQQSILFSRVYKLVQDLQISFQKLTYAYHQLEKTMEEKNLNFDFGYILFILVDTKYKNIIKHVQEIYSILAKQLDRRMSPTIHFRIILNSLAQFKDRESVRKIESIGPLTSIQLALKELVIQIESLILEESSVQFKSSNLSMIKTNGNIIVKGSGVVQTDMFSGKDIVFKKADSVIRGGKVEALKSIRASIVGTDTGQAPNLYAGELISMKTVYQCKLRFPGKIFNFDEFKENLTLAYDKSNDEVKDISVNLEQEDVYL